MDRPLTMGQFEVTGVVWLFRISPFPNSPLRRAGDFVVEGSNVLSLSSKERGVGRKSKPQLKSWE